MKLIIILAGFKKNIIKYEFFRIRTYAQFSMFSQAIKYFEKSMYIWNERELSNEITCENGKEYDKKENIFKEIGRVEKYNDLGRSITSRIVN